MSFILDALRKSEHERQRQTGPALVEVPVAAPRPRSNVWAPVAIGLLLVNLAVVGVWLIRKAVHEPAPSPPPAAAVVTSAPATAPLDSSRAGTAAGSPPVTVIESTPANPGAATVASPMSQPASAATSATSAVGNPLEAETTDGPPMLDPGMAARAAAAPPGPPAVTRVPASRGSVVYESLPDSATVGSQRYAPQAGTGRGASSAGADSGLASADELSGAGVPALNLDLHMYSTTPAERLVFINSRKYREGDTLQEGPRVRQITPTGVVLEYNGRSYLLTHN